MNNNDTPKKLNAEAHWTNFLDQHSQGAINPNQESSSGKMTHCDLTQGHLDDLEVDAMIREFGRSEQDEHEFVGQVLGKLELPNSHPVPRKKVRLPVPAPVFETEFDDTDDLVSTTGSLRQFAAQLYTRKSVVIGLCLALAMLIGYWTFEGSGNAGPNNIVENDGSSATGLVADDRTPDVDDSIAGANTDDGSSSDSQVGKEEVDSRLAWLLNNEWPSAGGPGSTGEMLTNAPPTQRWRLQIQFDKFGMGSIDINGKSLPEVVFCGSTDMILKNIGREVKARFDRLQPHMASAIEGTVSINDRDFHFAKPDEIEETIAAAAKFVNSIQVEAMAPEEFMRLRSESIRAREFRDFMAAYTDQNPRDDSTGPDQLGNVLVTKDEEVSINLVVNETESFLRDWANQVAQWQVATNTPTEDLATFAANTPVQQDKISKDDFDKFRLEGKKLIVANIPPNIDSQKQLQSLSAEELRLQLLENTRSMDVFENIEQARNAELYVRKNDRRGVSEMDNQLSQRLVSIEQELVRRNAVGPQNPVDFTLLRKLENQYVETAEELDEFRRKNGVEPLLEFLNERPDLNGLPLVMGDECHMEPEQALAMSHISKTVGVTLAQFDRFGTRNARENDSWRYNMLKDKIATNASTFNDEHSLTTLDQMLQVDHPRLRVELIEALENSDTQKGIELLARRAKFDLTPEVRLAATEALATIDPKKYRQYLLDGFSYPWAAVAEHSAETLVRVNDTGALDQLVQLLRAPNPNIPQKNQAGGYVKKEVVAINHMKNCFLCHAPSTGVTDRGRAVVPTWNQPLPRLYYHAPEGSFVRADTTYLRQDFSVMQEVEDHGPWPKQQRYDYVVYSKELSNEEARDYFQKHQNPDNKQREAVLFALRELTGMSPNDDSHATWVAAVEDFKRAQKKK